MSVILILVIIIIAFLKISKQNIENFSNNITFDHKKKKTKSKCIDNKLKIINEYNRQEIPRYIKIEILDTINKNILNTFKNRISIIDIEHLKISKYPGYTMYYIEIFLLDNTVYTTNKFIINYTIKNGGNFKLDDIRIYSFKDDKVNDNNNIYGLDRYFVESRKNLSNPFIDNSLNPGIQNNSKSKLEYSTVQKELTENVNKNILNKNIKNFNSTILPKHIVDKSLYMTMTPDFFNLNIYPVEINNDIFSRTRGIPSYPSGKSTY